jgi:hypothetical protein
MSQRSQKSKREISSFITSSSLDKKSKDKNFTSSSEENDSNEITSSNRSSSVIANRKSKVSR